MKLCKSFLNPIRATRNGGTASLSFLRRRCSSRCGGQPSPPLPAASGKRKGGGGTAADNPEPSSPKVTCVGQVRVKSKRRGRKHRRSLSQRRMGEASFRRAEQLQRKNQRWVHLPVSALREFGSDFTCVLFPCCCFNCRLFKSDCCCTNHDNNNPREENGGCGCAAILGRWLVCGNRSEEIMAVAGVGDAEGDEAEGMCVEICSRQHVFDNIEVRNGRIEVRGRSVDVEEEEEERGTVSICVPPKNALLLMRCRSDPTKMAALANRYCNCEYTKHEYIEEEEEEEDEDSNHGEEGKFESEIVFEEEMKGLQQDLEVSFKLSEEKEEEIQMEVEPELKNTSEEEEVNDYEEQDEEMKAQDDDEDEEEEIESNISPFEALMDHENLSSNYQEKVEETHLSPSAHSEREEENEKGEETEQWTQQEDEEKENIETPNFHEPKNHKQLGNSKKEEEEEEDEKEEEESKEVLPDCLLLMMCEPKLSMEVSKETWVRGADFIRWFPEKPRKTDKSAAGCEHYHPKGRPPPAAEPKPKNPIPAPPTRKKYGLPHQLLQPPRSSCSLPSAATSMANGTELGFGPISLPRCKSEPTRTAAEKLAPD